MWLAAPFKGPFRSTKFAKTKLVEKRIKPSTLIIVYSFGEYHIYIYWCIHVSWESKGYPTMPPLQDNKTIAAILRDGTSWGWWLILCRVAYILLLVKISECHQQFHHLIAVTFTRLPSPAAPSSSTCRKGAIAVKEQSFWDNIRGFRNIGKKNLVAKCSKLFFALNSKRLNFPPKKKKLSSDGIHTQLRWHPMPRSLAQLHGSKY